MDNFSPMSRRHSLQNSCPACLRRVGHKSTNISHIVKMSLLFVFLMLVHVTKAEMPVAPNDVDDLSSKESDKGVKITALQPGQKEWGKPVVGILIKRLKKMV